MAYETIVQALRGTTHIVELVPPFTIGNGLNANSFSIFVKVIRGTLNNSDMLTFKSSTVFVHFVKRIYAEDFIEEYYEVVVSILSPNPQEMFIINFEDKIGVVRYRQIVDK